MNMEQKMLEIFVEGPNKGAVCPSSANKIPREKKTCHPSTPTAIKKQATGTTARKTYDYYSPSMMQ